jgi:hypothetical protein
VAGTVDLLPRALVHGRQHANGTAPERVREAGEEEEADQVIAFTQRCVVVPLDTPIALFVADLRRQHKLATADAIIDPTACARAQNC